MKTSLGLFPIQFPFQMNLTHWTFKHHLPSPDIHPPPPPPWPPPHCLGDGVVQEARLSPLLSPPAEVDQLQNGISLLLLRHPPPCSPGWIAPLRPGSLSLSADAGAGCSPARSASSATGWMSQRKKPSARFKIEATTLYWICFSGSGQEASPPPPLPHHGFQLQRHSETGIRADTE